MQYRKEVKALAAVRALSVHEQQRCLATLLAHDAPKSHPLVHLDGSGGADEVAITLAALLDRGATHFAWICPDEPCLGRTAPAGRSRATTGHDGR